VKCEDGRVARSVFGWSRKEVEELGSCRGVGCSRITVLEAVSTQAP